MRSYILTNWQQEKYVLQLPMASGQKKYLCSFCSKAFSRSEHKARHERSHTGVKPFECKVCRHAFVRRDLLQRHIRTVHRDLLVLKRKTQQEEELRSGDSSSGGGSGNDDGGKNDIYMELLVNSMIRVNNDTLGVPPASRHGKRRLSSDPTHLDDDQCFTIYDLFRKYTSTAGIAMERIHYYYGVGMRQLLPDSVWARAMQVADNGVVLAIICLGAFEDDALGTEIWQIGCSNISDIIALSIMARALLIHDRTPLNMEQFFNRFQRVYLDARVPPDHHWLVFDTWVQLLRISRQSDEISILLLEKILNFKVDDLDSLKNLLTNLSHYKALPLRITDYLANVTYCLWLFYGRFKKSHILRSKAEFHSVLLLINDHYYQISLQRLSQFPQLQLPDALRHPITKLATPLQSESHWLLLETFWFEFMDQINNNQIWFMDTIAPIDLSLINENLGICAIPILSLVQQQHQQMQINSRYISLITDVVIFLLRIFEFELSISNLKQHPNRIFKLLTNKSVQLLFAYERYTILKHFDTEIYAIDHFINDFILNENRQETSIQIQSNFQDEKSMIFTGYRQLVQLIITHLKEHVIIGFLLKLPTLKHNVKVRLMEMSFESRKRSMDFSEETVPPSIGHSNDTWQVNHGWTIPSTSARQTSISSPTAAIEELTLHSTSMANSNSCDSSSFRNSNIILPPLNINSMRRASLDQSLMSRNQFDYPLHSPTTIQTQSQPQYQYQFPYQQQPPHQNIGLVDNSNINQNSLGSANLSGTGSNSHAYSYGPEPVSPKTIPQNSKVNRTPSTSYGGPYGNISTIINSPPPFAVPADPNSSASNLTNTTSSNSNGSEQAFSDQGSPQSVNSNRLPPPSKLFGISSK